jgi:hypothetical protein
MVVTQSEEYDVQVLILKRLRTILGLWGGIVDYYCPHEQKLGKRFLFYDLFAIRDDGEDFCSSMWFFDAARVLITLAFSGWDEPEEDKTQLKVLKLTKQLLGAIYNYMEARIEGAALRNIKDGLYADFVASWVNKELVVLNPQLQKLDHQALSLVRELMRYDKAHQHVHLCDRPFIKIDNCICDLQ